MDKVVLPTASSGIAASNIPSGRTTHSRFKIPLDTDEGLTCHVPKQGDLAKLLRKESLIIWDEASMARKENVEVVDRLLQDVCSCDKPFGGDFRQVLPVIPKKSQQEIVDVSLVSSYLWPIFQRFTLHENMRAREDPKFSKFLLNLGNGELQTSESEAIQIPSALISSLQNREEPMKLLVDSVYPDIKDLAKNPTSFASRAILSPTNDEVDSINRLMIDNFPGIMRRYNPGYYSPPRRGYSSQGSSPPRGGYSPLPPRRGYSPPRRGYGGYGRRKDQNHRSLLVRNIPLHCRPEELRVPFERFGVVRDVYIPKDYYTVYEGQRDMLYNQTFNLEQVSFAAEGIKDAQQTDEILL